MAVPSPLSVKVTPVGRLPVSDMAGTGVPVAVTVSGGRPLHEGGRVGARDARRNGNVDIQREGLGGVGADAVVGADGDRVLVPLPFAGVPARVAVPSPLSVKVTPLGSDPFPRGLAAGKPLVVTVKLPALAVEKVVGLPLVMPAASSTVSVKDWLALRHAVVRTDDERVGATAPAGRRAGQGGGAVTVVGEGHAAGQASRFRRAPRWDSPPRSP